MDQRTIQLFFALLRSAIRGEGLTEEERTLYSEEQLPDLIKLSQSHDIVHLIAYGLKQNSLISKNNVEMYIFKAAYRYEQLNYEYEQICSVFESAEIPFIPLKGSILRRYYPEPWMRTSCDIDVLVHCENLERAVETLCKKLQYEVKERATHDISLFSPGGNHIELHFDLVEEGRANNAINVLSSVWENVSLRKGCSYFYEMSDEFFYFYHVAHMAKHFEGGGCGVRPFIDLWILDHIEEADRDKRDGILLESKLLQFTNVARKLSAVWFDKEESDRLSLQMQSYILHGGVYGSSDNHIALQQKKRGGRIGYFFSRVFIRYSILKRYYPILEKHRWLTPFMQVRRWFMIFNPSVAKRAKNEIVINNRVEKSQADEMKEFLDNIGL